MSQRVVRYRAGKGDDVVELFRRVVETCPQRTLDGGWREKWTVLVDKDATKSDSFIVRRQPADSPFPSYYVVVRSQDVVSLTDYWPGESSTGDDQGARQLAKLTAKRLAATARP